MLIYHSCRLRAAVTSCAIEIEGGDAVLAEGAAVGRFGCVISHISIVVLPLALGLGHWVGSFRAGNRNVTQCGLA